MLQCTNSLNFEPLPHQIQTAKRVVDELSGRAILADEVGLGKTIEAGLIVKELLEIGQIKRVLVLTPSSLAPQWCMEMKEKFDLYFYHNRHDHNWKYFDFIVSSIDRAKREEHLNAICQSGFDMLIVDEAHRLKNNTSANFKAVQKVNPRYMLLLTATPLQNNLHELYNLVELIRPDLFGSYDHFQQEFTSGNERVKNLDQLQAKLSEVMVRNHKSEIDLSLPARKVHLVPVQLSATEIQLYNGVNAYIRSEYKRRRLNKLSVLSLLTLQREMCSSSFAARDTLARMGLNDLAELAGNIQFNVKAHAAKEIIKGTDCKVIVFTQFKATQAYLWRYLAEAGINALCYNGDLKPWQRIWIRNTFQADYPVLISTEAGGEGINLQQANVVINYDLPWNPMRVEQRIGRVHRLGQNKDVLIYNLYAENTVEELILKALRRKIGLFQDTIGKLEEIVDCEGDLGLFDYVNSCAFG